MKTSENGFGILSRRAGGYLVIVSVHCDVGVPAAGGVIRACGWLIVDGIDPACDGIALPQRVRVSSRS